MASAMAVGGEWAVPGDKAAFDRAIVDSANYAQEARYHAIMTTLRRDAPLYRCEPAGFRPFRVVSRHADIRRVELDHRTFVNYPRMNLQPLEMEERVMAATGGRRYTARHLVVMDHPDHHHYRSLTQRWFTAKQLRPLEDRIRELAREAVDDMAARDGACDFVHDVALWFPLRVILMTLGLGREDEKFLMKITQEIFGPDDPDSRRSADPNARFETIAEFSRWCDALTAARRDAPGDDVATVIANAAAPDGGPIASVDAMAYYLIIATAGHDTTSSSASAGLLELIRHPAELRKLRADPALLPNAVDEIVRWSSPVKHFFRTAASDTEVAGEPVAAGEHLMMAYPSANRDEAVFDDPFAFRVDRRNAREHLAFGYGPHLCLGQHLAKLELRILFEELLARFDRFELAGEPAWTQSSFVSGMKRLPIRYA
ncbi:cytochrome P450 [Sphingomonas corticis]|uniref:Cytochrome P450 n=1 Tax=Sphingomonas corticis TaxID=2722791 RepID=A0ABX1CPI5_9SPHN|nr:cytochrome P450 [Sphingomonas corticis]NJR78573.1 cytochrome P450 [Sphingomonas corticis]